MTSPEPTPDDIQAILTDGEYVVSVGHGLGLTEDDEHDEPDVRPIPDPLCAAIDFQEDTEGLEHKLADLIEAGWSSHEAGDLPAEFADQFAELIAQYVDAVRRAAR